MTSHPPQSGNQGSYASAGVSIDAATRAKELIKPLAKSTKTPGVLSDIGFFGGLFKVEGYREPVLVSSTDSVGTKVLLAIQSKRLTSVGHDIVNHCVNDIFVGGADPLFFLDYIGLGKIVPEEVEQIVQGLAAACKAAGCALICGETAEMPGLYRLGDFDLVGFIVGAVERENIINGSAIREGDVLLGLPSSGLHTNGFTLARRVLGTDANPSLVYQNVPELGRPLIDALLEPHRNYHPILKPVTPLVHGMAHITGGGLPGNVNRILPEGLTAVIARESWIVPPLFQLIQRRGQIGNEEMARVFNLGIGMVVAVAPGNAAEVLRRVPEAFRIGSVEPQRGAEQVLLV